MLIRSWDASTDAEWRAWLATGPQFGQLIAVGADCRPVVAPAPFLFDGDATVLLHLAKANPLWPALELRGEAMLTVVDDYAHIPGTWRPQDGDPPDHGVPTEFYAAAQLSGTVEIVDEPAAKAELLRRQLGAYGMAADHADVNTGDSPYAKQLNAIRGIVLHLTETRAKFKFDDRRTVDVQREVARRLAERATGRDLGAYRQAVRRLAMRTNDS